jgi:drug/metabolite transporter (DMT)-like permease
MWKPIAIAFMAACGNALFVYGQRAAGPSANPFLFTFGATASGVAMLLVATLAWQTEGNAAYLTNNALNVGLGGIGFFVTYLGFFLLFSGYGASQYALYATFAILTTSVGIGVLVFREQLNIYQIVAMLLAVCSIALWTYGRSLGAGA